VKAGWGVTDIPGLTGRTAIVTGASGGIGYEIAAVLAARGAHVVLASRSADRGIAAGVLIGQRAPRASTEARVLDLASLKSVRQFATWFGEQHGRLDVLVNNAGITGGPRRETAEGFEAHFGVNHLGHFALTGLLFPRLGNGSRVVTMSTGLAAQARIDFADPQGERRYRMTAAYGQSKLAQLMFAFEFDHLKNRRWR
jgi:NAD(P)-dependent dehydrogenase (short-subunit alcohol dehydrogenase family)